MFLFFLIKAPKNFLKLIKENLLIKILIIFFFFQSISILVAYSITDFLKKYIDSFYYLIFFINGLLIFKKKEERDYLNFFKIIFFVTIINIIFKIFIYLDFEKFSYLFSDWINSAYINLIKANLDRGRLYFSSFDEASFPVILYLFFLEKNIISKILYFCFTILIILTTILTNFRTIFFMLIFSIFGSLLIFYQKFNYKSLILFIVFILIIFLNINFIKSLSYETVIDRLILDETQSISLISRIEQIKSSFDIALKSFLGVGLGNYYLYTNKKPHLYLNKETKILTEESVNYPHNIFALIVSDAGFFALFAYLSFIFTIFKDDIKNFMTKKMEIKVLIISFWSLFFYCLFNPTDFYYYNIYFFGLRVFIL
ncbi:MAG: hypothetical protein Fur009_6200 [Candidatus Microgenomates bacterium]